MKISNTGQIEKFLSRVFDGKDVAFEEISDIVIDTTNVEQSTLLRDFWNELAITVNDFDIRADDAGYDSDRMLRLRELVTRMQREGLLEDNV